MQSVAKFSVYLYESLQTTAIRLSNLPEFKEDVLASGVRIGSNEVGLVYMVLVVSNKMCFEL